ncbi:MAG TPA: NUDIX hydrolase [Acidimicrobiales bacterium]|nr:NUDIX hydrolase [Acidimicrobiales bacterium]
MRDWLVGGGLVTGPEGVLLVQNRRRDGRLDWSPPGGVIDPGETLIGGLTREVEEETGLRVTGWAGPTYEIVAEAPDMGWRLRVEAHRSTGHEGDVAVEDPDGIVVAAAFVGPAECRARLAGAPRWVGEPVCDWLAAPWDGTRSYAYRVEGTLAAGTVAVHRLP